jgi:hypothetical protein
MGDPERQREPVRQDRVQLWVSRNLQTIAFLGAYFVTTVAGNFVLASPLASQSLSLTEYSPRFLEFPNTFTLGFWTLLLCPFLVTPLVVILTRRAVEPWVSAHARDLPEFGRVSYVVVVSLCFIYVIYRFWTANVTGLFASGVDMASSIEARFAIRERLGFFTFVPLQALLPFLTVYAVIRWMGSRQVFWMGCALIDFLLLSVLLVMTNMKWPVLLFYVAIVLAIFVYAKRHAYLKAAVGALLVFLALLGISSFVFRMVPQGLRASAPTIVWSALYRMAVSYPYYYQVFTAEGPVCGGIVAQAHRNPPCRPSHLIYTRMFGNNGFENRGTEPLAVHLSGYALGGWPIAIVALIAASVILGFFRAVPLDAGSMSGAVVILGALAGYHLSQVPGEGVVFYEHGLFWTFLLIGGYALWCRVAARVRPRLGPQERETTA